MNTGWGRIEKGEGRMWKENGEGKMEIATLSTGQFYRYGYEYD